jgi:hypothetical protein
VETVVWKRTEPHPLSRGRSRNRLALRLSWCKVRCFRTWQGRGVRGRSDQGPQNNSYSCPAAIQPRLTTTTYDYEPSSARHARIAIHSRSGPSAVLQRLACHSRTRAPTSAAPPQCPSRSFLDERTDIACDAHSPLTAGRSTGRYLITSISIATRIALAASLRKSTRPSIAPQSSWRSLDNPKSTNIG